MVYICGLSKESIEIALNRTNAQFNNNIVFKRIEKSGRKYIVTLTVKDSHGAGARIGWHGRAISAACWHVYGTFFDECFTINPFCTIKQCGKPVTPENNWTDWNIGSIVQPLMYSDACHCGGQHGRN